MGTIMGAIRSHLDDPLVMKGLIMAVTTTIIRHKGISPTSAPLRISAPTMATTLNILDLFIISIKREAIKVVVKRGMACCSPADTRRGISRISLIVPVAAA